MNGIRRIVLDILKPHEPKITDMALKLTSLSNIDGVNITVYEIDKETENVKVTIEGKLSLYCISCALSATTGGNSPFSTRRRN